MKFKILLAFVKITWRQFSIHVKILRGEVWRSLLKYMVER